MTRHGSLAPSAITADRLPPRQRWDHRYAGLPSDARLKPTPFVAAHIPGLPAAGRALDVAAGAGRHILALAQHGLAVDAVDISAQGLHLARQRLAAAGLWPSPAVRLVAADIERPWLPHGLYEVIVVSFFLHRPLFPLLKDRLKPGGWLLYESFTVDQPVAPNHQPIRRGFLLEHNELRAAFAGLEILFYDEGDHHGKATAQLLARKP
jgi:SAM-dependent methyltransferase